MTRSYRPSWQGLGTQRSCSCPPLVTVSYVYPNVNAAGAGLFLSETLTLDTSNLAATGYNMYHQMIEWLGRPARNVPRHHVPPLKVAISRKLREVVEAKYKNAGVEKGKFVAIHGMESDSKASMQSRVDTHSLLPIEHWAEISKGIRGVMPVFVIPHEKERENVVDIVGDDATIVFITTPGQLAALINNSAGVVATSTAAIQLAHAREKPSGIVLLRGEGETGNLVDIDVEAVKIALQIFSLPLVLCLFLAYSLFIIRYILSDYLFSTYYKIFMRYKINYLIFNYKK